jgi:hypothetical protein
MLVWSCSLTISIYHQSMNQHSLIMLLKLYFIAYLGLLSRIFGDYKSTTTYQMSGVQNHGVSG